jgi:uncharacterized membrane protein
MPIALTVLYALHVLCGITWFGGALFTLLVLGPAFSRVSGSAMAEVGPRVGAQASKVMPAAAAGTLLLGIATAYATGRFTTPSALFADAYGVTVLTALALAVSTYAWGKYVVEARVHVMKKVAPPEKQAAFSRVMQSVAVEQGGFIAILLCMVLLRFGY